MGGSVVRLARPKNKGQRSESGKLSKGITGRNGRRGIAELGMGWFPGALVSAGGWQRPLALESHIGRKLEQQAALRCARGPAARLAYRSVGEAMER
jgi:hypothetical protein